MMNQQRRYVPAVRQIGETPKSYLFPAGLLGRIHSSFIAKHALGYKLDGHGDNVGIDFVMMSSQILFLTCVVTAGLNFPSIICASIQHISNRIASSVVEKFGFLFIVL
jgi:hypothetical protein